MLSLTLFFEESRMKSKLQNSFWWNEWELVACIFTRRSQKIEIAEARAHVCAHEERRVKYFHKMKKCCAAHLLSVPLFPRNKTKRKEIVKGVVICTCSTFRQSESKYQSDCNGNFISSWRCLNELFRFCLKNHKFGTEFLLHREYGLDFSPSPSSTSCERIITNWK